MQPNTGLCCRSPASQESHVTLCTVKQEAAAAGSSAAATFSSTKGSCRWLNEARGLSAIENSSSSSSSNNNNNNNWCSSYCSTLAHNIKRGTSSTCHISDSIAGRVAALPCLTPSSCTAPRSAHRMVIARNGAICSLPGHRSGCWPDSTFSRICCLAASGCCIKSTSLS